MHKLLPVVLLLFPGYFLRGQPAFDPVPCTLIAQKFVASLTPEQKNKGCFDFDDSTRTRWSNLPFEQYHRRGLRLDELSDAQKTVLHQLLRSTLSVEGYQKVMFIIQYDEDIKTRLAAANNPIWTRYGQEKYWISIFGNPDTAGVWAWKFEGHHLSLNFTHGPQGTSATPMFVGINPAQTASGPFAGRYLMADENELAKQLFASLSATLRQKAVLGELPSNADPLAQTGEESFLREKSGLALRELSAWQQDLAVRIIRAWAENLAEPLAGEKMATVLKNQGDIRFAWMGSEDPEALHYFRLWNTGFCVELTNRDQGIQHLHSLWRIPGEDFGKGTH